jgi:hypothetical protein
MTQRDKADKGWKESFHEHLYEKDIDIGENRELKTITAFVFAGDPHCSNPPETKFMARESCRVGISYENKDWVWQKLPDLIEPNPAAPK